MRRGFHLPSIGDAHTEAEIVEWLVDVGHVVAADQDLVEVVTAKASVTIPSPWSGTVLERHGEAGDVVAVGSLLIVLEGVAEATSRTPVQDGPGPAGVQAAVADVPDADIGVLLASAPGDCLAELSGWAEAAVGPLARDAVLVHLAATLVTELPELGAGRELGFVADAARPVVVRGVAGGSLSTVAGALERAGDAAEPWSGGFALARVEAGWSAPGLPVGSTALVAVARPTADRRVPLTFVFDRNVLDDATAARAVARLVELLDSPEAVLL